MASNIVPLNQTVSSASTINAQILPNALETICTESNEMAVIGAVLAHPDLYPELRQIISPDDFGYLMWAKAWEACDLVVNRGDVINLNLIGDELDMFIGKGDASFVTRKRLSEAIGSFGNKANAKRYAQRVRDSATKLRLYSALVDSRNMVLDPNTDAFVDTVIEESLRKIHNAVEGRHGRKTDLQDKLSDIVGSIENVIDNGVVAETTYATGLFKWDRETEGLPVGEVTVMMGYTGHGKSTLAIQIAAHQAKRGQKVIIFSREEVQDEILARFISLESGLPKKLIQLKKLGHPQYKQFLDGSGKVSEYINNIELFDRQDCYPELTPTLIRLKIDECLNRGERPLVILDGLWLMQPDKTGIDDWFNVYERITWELGEVASRPDREVAILCLHQMSEGLPKRPKKTMFPPVASDADGGKKAMHNVQTLWCVVRPHLLGVNVNNKNETWLFNVKSRLGIQYGVMAKMDFYKGKLVEV